MSNAIYSSVDLPLPPDLQVRIDKRICEMNFQVIRRIGLYPFNTCYQNAEDFRKERKVGSVFYGWKLEDVSGILVSATHHAVYKDEHGEFLCVTSSPPSEITQNSLVFAPLKRAERYSRHRHPNYPTQYFPYNASLDISELQDLEGSFCRARKNFQKKELKGAISESEIFRIQKEMEVFSYRQRVVLLEFLEKYM